jgi:phospholipid/cholesterol/gamma-HCH transport system ATP-binding protein
VTTQDVHPSRRDDPGFVRLTAALGRMLEADPAALHRLKYARTTVAFRVAHEEPVTLLLDGATPQLKHGQLGEIEIELEEWQVDPFTRGRLPLAMACARGEVRFSGPVRKYLEVEPIMRGILLAQGAHNTDDQSETSRQAPERDRQLDSDLLAIRTTNLTKSFGPQRVLAGLDLAVPEGVVSVVLGPSGTGKSVLLQHVIGLMRPDDGDVIVRGRALGTMSRDELIALRRTIGVMFQDGALLGTMNVYDNTAFPLRQHTDLTEAEIREVVMERLQTVGLASAAHRMPNELSGGMRKRAGLARSLVLDPGILLCDEPDSGLDPVRASLLADLLLEEHARTGGTTLVVTHDIKLARYVADHISVIWQGRVVASGFADDVLASPDPFVQQFLSGNAHGPLSMD